MQEITKVIEIRLPLTSAEKVCLNATLAMYHKAYNYVSKYICKKRKLSQTELLKVLSEELESKYKLNKLAAKSIVKTVVNKYKEIYPKGKRWKRIRFKRKDTVFYWGIDYKITEESFYINTISGKIKFKVEDYDGYFCASPCIFFGPAKVKRKISGYYIVIPVTMEIEDCDRKEMIWINIGIKLVWRKLSKNILTR